MGNLFEQYAEKKLNTSSRKYDELSFEAYAKEEEQGIADIMDMELTLSKEMLVMDVATESFDRLQTIHENHKEILARNNSPEVVELAKESFATACNYLGIDYEEVYLTAEAEDAEQGVISKTLTAIKKFFVSIWETIVKYFKKVWNWVFGKKVDEATEKKANDVAEKMDNVPDQVVKDLVKAEKDNNKEEVEKKKEEIAKIVNVNKEAIKLLPYKPSKGDSEKEEETNKLILEILQDHFDNRRIMELGDIDTLSYDLTTEASNNSVNTLLNKFKQHFALAIFMEGPKVASDIKSLTKYKDIAERNTVEAMNFIKDSSKLFESMLTADPLKLQELNKELVTSFDNLRKKTVGGDVEKIISKVGKGLNAPSKDIVFVRQSGTTLVFLELTRNPGNSRIKMVSVSIDKIVKSTNIKLTRIARKEIVSNKAGMTKDWFRKEKEFESLFKSLDEIKKSLDKLLSNDKIGKNRVASTLVSGHTKLVTSVLSTGSKQLVEMKQQYKMINENLSTVIIKYAA